MSTFFCRACAAWVSTVSPTTLADCVTQVAQLTPDPRDRIREFTKANYLVVSTPEEKRARKLCSDNTILVKGKQHEFAAHVSALVNTTARIIFNIPEEDSQAEINQVLINSNPDLPILAARRLGKPMLYKSYSTDKKSPSGLAIGQPLTGVPRFDTRL